MPNIKRGLRQVDPLILDSPTMDSPAMDYVDKSTMYIGLFTDKNWAIHSFGFYIGLGGLTPSGQAVGSLLISP